VYFSSIFLIRKISLNRFSYILLLIIIRYPLYVMFLHINLIKFSYYSKGR